MDVLPDLVGARPRVVFCGMACAEATGRRDHYYAGPGNSFWQMLPAIGLALTDVVRHISTSPPTYDVEELVAGGASSLSWPTTVGPDHLRHTTRNDYFEPVAGP